MPIDHQGAAPADLLALCKASDMQALRQVLGQSGLMGQSIAALRARVAPQRG